MTNLVRANQACKYPRNRHIIARMQAIISALSQAHFAMTVVEKYALPRMPDGLEKDLVVGNIKDATEAITLAKMAMGDDKED